MNDRSNIRSAYITSNNLIESTSTAKRLNQALFSILIQIEMIGRYNSGGRLSTSTAASATLHAARPALTVLRLPRTSILSQLRMEESLLRADDHNWCIINQPQRNSSSIDLNTNTEQSYRSILGSSTMNGTDHERAIVLGLSGDPHSLVHLRAAREDNVQLIRRFSGGTVYTDHCTKFITLIVNSNALPSVVRSPDL